MSRNRHVEAIIAALAAGYAHVPADARPIVATVDNEIVALRLEPDGPVDRSCKQGVVA